MEEKPDVASLSKESKYEKIKNIFSGRYNKIVGVALLLIVIAAVPLTVFVSQQEQDLRQRAEAPTYRVFLTSRNDIKGNMNSTTGGLAAADGICQTLADTAQLGGTWKAFLSDNSTNAKDRIPDGQYATAVKNTKIANDKNHLLDGTLITNFNETETGTVLPEKTRAAWTGSENDGTHLDKKNDRTCSNWTISDKGNGIYGTPNNSKGRRTWIKSGTQNCKDPARLYCFEVTTTATQSATLTPTATPTATLTPPVSPTPADCSSSDRNGRSAGCSCRSDNQCKSDVCAKTDNRGEKTCQGSSVCDITSNKPDGCFCRNKNQCTSNKCEAAVNSKFCGGVLPTPTPTSPPIDNPPGITLTPGHTSLSFKLNLQAIGASTSGLNDNPANPVRQLEIKIYPVGTDQSVAAASGPITYDNTFKQFKGVIDMGALLAGNYDVKVHTNKYLVKLIPNQSIKADQPNDMPTVGLIVGDSNNDNVLDILDYNIVTGPACFGKDAPFIGGCEAADLNDDGHITIIDANFLFTNFGKQHGD